MEFLNRVFSSTVKTGHIQGIAVDYEKGFIYHSYTTILLKTDLLSVMRAVSEGNLSKIDVEFLSESACCVIMASEGYPSSYKKGYELDIPEAISDNVYIAGAQIKDGKLLTNGGRVLGATKVAPTLEEAVNGAYELVSKIKFGNAFYRKDIGKKALDTIKNYNE